MERHLSSVGYYWCLMYIRPRTPVVQKNAARHRTGPMRTSENCVKAKFAASPSARVGTYEQICFCFQQRIGRPRASSALFARNEAPKDRSPAQR